MPMKKLWIAGLLGLGAVLVIAGIVLADGVRKLDIKKGDLLPYYTAQVVNSSGSAVDISSDTITARLENISTGVEVVTDQACVITNGASGEFELRWVDGTTNTAGSYAIEFKRIHGGKQTTLPAGFDAIINIGERR
jgi:hypothetical protein